MELKTCYLRDIKLKELHLAKQELQRETKVHCAFQSQYEALLASKAKNEELAEEECSGKDIKYQHRQLMQQLCDLIERFQFYQEAVSIREYFDVLEKIPDITTRVFEKAFSKLTLLCWLQKPSSSLKTFVANRVSSNQELLPSSQ